jgi:hypothetical protein
MSIIPVYLAIQDKTNVDEGSLENLALAPFLSCVEVNLVQDASPTFKQVRDAVA